MSIQRQVIIGYTWEVWYSGSCLHEDDEVFDTEEEATEEAKAFCKDRLAQWESDGFQLDGDEMEDLINGIVINDVVKSFDDEDDEEEDLW